MKKKLHIVKIGGNVINDSHKIEAIFNGIQSP